jgi:ribosomal protein S18 acetylase RimI-like enzyme
MDAASAAVTIRALSLPADREAVEAIDASVEADRVYAVVTLESGFRIDVEAAGRFVRTEFPVAEIAARDWDAAFVAVAGGSIAGVVASSMSEWNRRLRVRHLYVDAPARRSGIGRLLLEHALADGARRGAVTAWLETPSTNYPGVQAYLAMGFELCGLDTAFYGSTAAAGDVALFLSRSIA